MQQQFVHLRVHTEYSMIDGIVRIPSLMSCLQERGMDAIAITDNCNLFAAVKWYKSATSKGIKPIIGADIPIINPQTNKVSSMVLLCQNDEGYLNLTKLISRAYLQGQHHGVPSVKKEWVSKYAAGLIALSGGIYGDVGQAIISGEEKEATSLITQWQNVFPNRYYLEIQRTGKRDEELYNEQLVSLADSLNTPLVATNNVCFLNQDDFDAHNARVCIHDGVTLESQAEQTRYTNAQYLKTADEMAQLFSDLPQALENTVEIAKRCTKKLSLDNSFLPSFPTPGGMSVEDYLSDLSAQGLETRLQRLFKPEEIAHKRQAYDERLKIELKVINEMGFPGYFLIVADFIQWAKDNDIPVGPGRGSGAGSLVAYVLNITDLDPLAYELLFERFLNPERVSMPDFDIDFCMEGRDRVIDYVAEKYGRYSVSQIITFGTMAAKAVLRDVGRVLGHSYTFVDKLAKLVPFEIGMTLSKALNDEPLLRKQYEEEEEVKNLIDLALKLEGVTRNAGKHAGGVVIAPSQLTDFTAIYCEQGSTQLVSQLDKDDVEAVGLVKFDFLGLKTLTIIDWAIKIVNQKLESETKLDISEIPLDDEASFKLLKDCKTTAVFQLESRGMKELIRRLQPDCFEDIIALVALFRPGPLQSGMVDDFIDRKHGRAKVVYAHPDLEPILQPTYGVILYQEQVMQIAQVLANYTLGGADVLRRAMGKKKPEEMAKQREIFSKGAQERGIDESLATYVFDLMEKFAGYGFNKSHSAAYALVAYQTAWLKANYPAAFMAAVLSADMDNTDKVVTFIRDCRELGIEVLAPSINKSLYAFSVDENDSLIYGLGAVKGIGEAVVQSLTEEREANGIYTGLFNLCERIDLRKVTRRVLEALIKCGAFDDWGVARATLFNSIGDAIKGGGQAQSRESLGQKDIMSLFADEVVVQEQYVDCLPWSDKERLDFEKSTLGYYLTGHPADIYCRELHVFATSLSALNPHQSKQAVTCGMIAGIRKITTKRGKKLAIIRVEDAGGALDVVVFDELFALKEERLANGDLLVVSGAIAHDDYSGGVKMTANELYSLDEARTRFGKCLRVQIGTNDKEKIPVIKEHISANPGQCLVQIQYSNARAQGDMTLGTAWKVEPNEELLHKLELLLGEGRVAMCY